MAATSFRFLLSCCVILSVFLHEITCIQHTPEVAIHSGKIRGRIDRLITGGAAQKYLGIPYAKAARFAHPSEPEPWSNIKDTIAFGKMCPQRISAYAALANMSEDCLSLNVFVPDGVVAPLPVMVWIHGGSFKTGSNRYDDGSYIATLGQVIVVAINYRLNVFGFMATGKDDDQLTGNYGMLDQIFALKWVQKNIKQFGGDPSKVTIFGVSAGSASVSHLVLSPLARGLFHNAILQAGDATAIWAYRTYSQASATARTIGRVLGCNDIDVLVSCMKKKTIKEIVQTAAGMSFSPVVGGSFLPADTPEALLRNEKIDVNMIIGFNDDEGSVITNAVKGAGSGYNITNGFARSDFLNVIRNGKRQFGGGSKIINEAIVYRYTDWNNVTDPYRNRRMMLDMFSDVLFLAPAIKSAEILVKKSVKVYMYQLQYRFSTRYGLPVPSWIRAYHAADKLVIFGEPFKQAALHNTSVNTKDANFSRVMINLWTNFAKTGDPNSPSSPGQLWPQYDIKQQQYLALKPTLSVQSKLRIDYMAFWNNFIPTAVKNIPTPPPSGPPTSVTSRGGTKTINGFTLSLVWSGLLCVCFR